MSSVSRHVGSLHIVSANDCSTSHHRAVLQRAAELRTISSTMHISKDMAVSTRWKTMSRRLSKGMEYARCSLVLGHISANGIGGRSKKKAYHGALSRRDLLHHHLPRSRVNTAPRPFTFTLQYTPRVELEVHSRASSHIRRHTKTAVHVAYAQSPWF
jgi:hypothetical protein